MAISTLTHKLKVCSENNCANFRVYDTTKAFSTENSGGWGSANTLPINITAASLVYKRPTDTSETTVDVTTNVNSQTTVTNEFLLTSVIPYTEDGLYSFTYILSVGSSNISTKIYTYELCKVRCCIDKLWAKVAINALSESCNCTEQVTSTLEKAQIAEGLYNAIKFGASCNSTAVKDELLKKLQRICSLEQCNCK